MKSYRIALRSCRASARNDSTLQRTARTEPRPGRDADPNHACTSRKGVPATSLLLLFLLSPVPALAAFPNGYSYCKVITTQHTMVSGTGDLSNFPLSVILTDPALKTTGSGGLVNNASGYDIGFYPDCSGSGTKLKWELESYSATTGALVAHVLRPTLSRTLDDTIGMFYGGPFSTFQGDAASVWDANYKGVWHLPNGTSLSALDSTLNAANATATNGASAVAGKIGGAASLNGATNYLAFGSVENITGTAFSCEAWVNRSNASNYFVFAGRNGTSGGVVPLQYQCTWVANLNDGGGGPGNNLRFNFLDSSGNLHTANDPTYMSDIGIWRHFAITYDGSYVKFYIDGAFSSQSAQSAAISGAAVSGLAFNIGGDLPRATNYSAGSIDEVRLSNLPRSADWILTEYRNQNSPATYLSVGSQVSSTTTTAVRHRVVGGD